MNSFRTYKSLMDNDVRNMSDLFFFEILRVTLLYNIYETSEICHNYIKRTIHRPISNPFSIRDTDLKGIMIYFMDIHNKELTTPDQILMNKIDVDLSYIHSYIKRIYSKRDIDTIKKTVIIKLIKDLNIQDPKLRAMASLVLDWNRLNTERMNILIDRMDNYGSLYFRRSELNTEIHNLNMKYKEARKEKNYDWLGAIVGGALGSAIIKKSVDSRNKNKKSMKTWTDKASDVKTFRNTK